jgi:hypothetical protein
LDAIKIPTTVVVSEEAMNDDWMMFAVRDGHSVTLFEVRKNVIVSLVGLCFCVHFFLPDAHDHCLNHLCSYYLTMRMLI